MLFVFQTFFTEKNGEIFKAFSPLFNFLLSFSSQTGKVVKVFWVFHLVSGRKLIEKKRGFSPRIQQKNLNFTTSAAPTYNSVQLLHSFLNALRFPVGLEICVLNCRIQH
jgi:hypothetical protein